jgi:hypothetical protein
MFITKNAIASHDGTSAGSSVGSSNPETKSSAANAANHPIELRTPPNIKAPTGAVKDHRTTPLDGTKPPMLSCSRNGSSIIIVSWLARKNASRFVRENTMSEAMEMPMYVSGIAAESGSPSAKYVTTHTVDSEEINRAVSVTTLFASRTSSGSVGSTPIEASRSTNARFAHGIRTPVSAGIARSR